MIKILLFIKHKVKFLWRFIESINGFIFDLLFGKRINATLEVAFSKQYHERYKYKRLQRSDLKALKSFFDNQSKEQLSFFSPHAFDLLSLERLYKNPAFIMMGVFDNDKLVGYFFLRFFFNKKCFIGRIVDISYQRQGIARYMNDIMYKTAWDNSFRCLTTISKHNTAIFKLHSQESGTIILRELPNDYLLVEMKDKPNKVQ